MRGATELEQEVIELRFGLKDGFPYTLEEVERELSVPNERIREIEASALKRLRQQGSSGD